MNENVERDDTELKDFLNQVKSKLRVQKIVCSRAIKGTQGTTFVGFSAAWDSVAPEEGGNQELVENAFGETTQGMSLAQARVAAHLLGMQTDVGAYERAAAGGNISREYADQAIKVIKANYSVLIRSDFEKVKK